MDKPTHFITPKNINGLGITEATDFNRNYCLLPEDQNILEVRFIGINPKNRRVAWISIVHKKDFDRLIDKYIGTVAVKDRQINKFAVYNYQLTKI